MYNIIWIVDNWILLIEISIETFIHVTSDNTVFDSYGAILNALCVHFSQWFISVVVTFLRAQRRQAFKFISLKVAFLFRHSSARSYRAFAEFFSALCTYVSRTCSILARGRNLARYCSHVSIRGRYSPYSVQFHWASFDVSSMRKIGEKKGEKRTGIPRIMSNRYE